MIFGEKTHVTCLTSVLMPAPSVHLLVYTVVHSWFTTSYMNILDIDTRTDKAKFAGCSPN